MKRINEQEFTLEYNKLCGQVIRQERKKRKLTLEELSSRVLSMTALNKVEKGKAQWAKLTGDILLLRMGISLILDKARQAAAVLFRGTGSSVYQRSVCLPENWRRLCW